MKFNKYKHKRSPWITSGILRSIKFRDGLYKNLKCTNQDTPLYLTRKHNLKVYNRILDKNIRQAKQDYYDREFNKFKHDTRKTWDVIKSVLNLNKSKKVFPQFFIIEDLKVTNKEEIAERFNTFFTNIGPTLARNIKSSKSPHFATYLQNCPHHTFAFEQTSASEISKLIHNFKSKSSTGHDKISM